MYTRDSALLSMNIDRIITDQGSTLGSFFKPYPFSWFVRKLFANGEQGFFYDPNDLSTMWQDQAKLLPVTGEGQPVWHILDKSGNNNHAFATSSATRPILRQNATTGAYYLAFDGVDDFLVTNNINFTATDKVSLFAGVRKLSDATLGVLVELSTNVTGVSGAFTLFTPRNSSTGSSSFTSKGTNLSEVVSSALLAPANLVFSAKSSISTDINILRLNAVQTSSGTDQGTGNYGNYPLYIGRRGGTALPFNGHIYGLIGVGKLVSDDETAAIEKELAKLTGVTL